MSVKHNCQYKTNFIGKVHYTHGYMQVVPPYWYITYIVHIATARSLWKHGDYVLKEKFSQKMATCAS